MRPTLESEAEPGPRLVAQLKAWAPVDDVLAGLCRSYLFEDLTAGDLQPLAGAVTTRTLVRDECVCRPRDPADEIWVVLSGEVSPSFAFRRDESSR